MRIGNFNIRRPGDPPRGPAGFQDEYHPWPDDLLPLLREALSLVERTYASNRSACDEVFRNSGHGGTLADLLRRHDLWISLSPYDDASIGYAEDPDIIVNLRACKHGPAALAAVIVHELGHINGIGGDYGRSDRFSHALADHAAFQCTGSLHPAQVIVRPVSAFFGCKTCKRGP